MVLSRLKATYCGLATASVLLEVFFVALSAEAGWQEPLFMATIIAVCAAIIAVPVVVLALSYRSLPKWWAIPIAGLLPTLPALMFRGYTGWSIVLAAGASGALGGFAYWALSEDGPSGGRLRNTFFVVCAALSVFAVGWASLWWTPDPLRFKTAVRVIRAPSGTYTARDYPYDKRFDSDACRLSARKLSHIAIGKSVRFPDDDCGWTRGDLDLSRQGVVAFLDDIDHDVAFYDDPAPDDGSPPSIGRPRYALLRTRASVVLGWIGPEEYGGARCYLLRTLKGWRAQSCRVWSA